MSEKRGIKLWEGINLTTKDGTVFCKGPVELWEHLNCNDETKTEIIRHLYCFGHLDLTEAAETPCVLGVVPVKRGGSNESTQ